MAEIKSINGYALCDQTAREAVNAFPEFKRISASEVPDTPITPDEPETPDVTGEYNLITLATEVSTIDDLKAFDGIAILKGYKHGYSTVEADANYDVIKIPVSGGDVIRSKLAGFWGYESTTTQFYYAFFYNASDTLIKTHYVRMGGHESPTYLDIRENGITAPDASTCVFVNIYYQYCGTGDNTFGATENGKTAEIITKNADASLTAYDGSHKAEDYVPVAERSTTAAYSLLTGGEDEYYEAVDDVRIPRYETALGDIETILADVVGGVE